MGRWLGHGIATIFAVISLINILQTFKRVLLHQRRRKARQLFAAHSKGADAADSRVPDQDTVIGGVPGDGGSPSFATTQIMQTIQTLEVCCDTTAANAISAADGCKQTSMPILSCCWFRSCILSTCK